MKSTKRVLCLLQVIFYIAVFSVSFVHSQKLQWQFSTGFQLPQAIVADESNQKYLYVAQKSGGLLVLETKNRLAKRIALIPKGQFKRMDAMNLVQQGRYLYVALGDFFRRNAKAGLAIIDIQNPRRPRVSSVWKSMKNLHGSADVEVHRNYAYLATMEHGVFVFDISNKNRIKEINRIKLDRNFPKRNPNRIQEPNARGLAIRNNLLYVANDAGGLRVVDVSNKRNPREIVKHILRRPKLKQQAYNNIAINYPYAYIALDYCGMEVVNIRNPRRIRHISWWNPWRCETNKNNWFNSPGHTNQIIFDKRTNQVFMSSGDSELQVIDVSSPRNPRLQSSFGRPKNNKGVWGLTITNDNIYLAYIRTFVPFKGTWSGIKAISR